MHAVGTQGVLMRTLEQNQIKGQQLIGWEPSIIITLLHFNCNYPGSDMASWSHSLFQSRKRFDDTPSLFGAESLLFPCRPTSGRHFKIFWRMAFAKFD